MKYLKDSCGSTLVYSIIVMAILGILASAIMPMITTELKAMASNRDVVEAQYAAEAGAKRVLVALRAESTVWDWANNSKQPFIDDTATRSYQISVQPNIIDGNAPTEEIYTITSTGIVNNITRSVTVQVDFTASTPATQGNPGNPGTPGTPAIPPTPSISSEHIMSTEQNMQFKNNANVNGSLGAGGSVTANKPINVTNGTIEQNQSGIEVPVFKVEDFAGAPSPPTTDAILDKPKYLRNGNWIVNNTINLNAKAGVVPIIFVNGNIEFKNNASFTGPMLIIATGTVYFKNNANLHRVVIVSYSSVTFDNNLNLEGAILATGNIEAKNNVTLNIDINAVNTVNQALITLGIIPVGGDPGTPGTPGTPPTPAIPGTPGKPANVSILVWSVGN